jgi:N6-adenosine-specific RNA methylase IME4
MFRTPAEWVSTAEKLAKKFGKLPCPKWLQKNGFCGLYSRVKNHPELFAHIPQDRKQRTPLEWVSIAEKLAKKHGKLPHPGWLEDHGFRGLYHFILSHPKLFSHIPQDSKKGRTPVEWVAIAEKLAKKHGKLPNPKWLEANGLIGLCSCTRNNRKLFTHIPQDRKKRTPLEWVAIAEKLAKKHGKLPYPGWLEVNGFRGLPQCMRQHPKLFSHIPQDSKKGQTAAQWVVFAEKLAKKHGKLPNPKWLEANVNTGLTHCMRQNPELFSHIPQDSKKGRT